jgi:hypothetical protein
MERNTVMSTAEMNGGPKKSVIPGQKVRVLEEAARVGAPSGEAGGHLPRVELIRDGEFVQAIDVQCTCGQKVRLKCIY